nr:site-specific integrase [Hansschlegelia quercus]
MIYANPVKLVRRPVAPKGRNRRLRAGEEQKLLDAADKGRNPHMRSIIIFAIETAMRRGEIVNLMWEHVDLDRRVAHVPVTKNGEPQDVPLSSRAVAAMTSSDDPREGKVFFRCPRQRCSRRGTTYEAGPACPICIFMTSAMRQ